MPVTIIGIKLSSGPPVSNPKMECSQPHWYTAVVAPNVASTLRRKPAVALIGTMMERNTSNKIMSERTTITPT
ncbi:hypothetical protein D3C78_1069920 [compost metagenome]